MSVEITFFSIWLWYQLKYLQVFLSYGTSKLETSNKNSYEWEQFLENHIQDDWQSMGDFLISGRFHSNVPKILCLNLIHGTLNLEGVFFSFSLNQKHQFWFSKNLNSVKYFICNLYFKRTPWTSPSKEGYLLFVKSWTWEHNNSHISL